MGLLSIGSSPVHERSNFSGGGAERRETCFPREQYRRNKRRAGGYDYLRVGKVTMDKEACNRELPGIFKDEVRRAVVT